MAWLYLFYLLEVLKWLIIVRAVMSWFVPPNSNNAAVDLVRRVTDPILRPIAGVIPNLGGVDISPLVALFAIILLQRLVVQMAAF
jgi:YggT family protein